MEKQYGYVKPQLPEGVQPVDLTVSASAGPVREPAENERVVCINRGRKPLVDTFDARHYEIPAGFFEIEYGAAKHLQRRLIVPGTRNITSNEQVSWIGILGVNPPELCEPFTDEQLAIYGENVEAIARDVDHGFGREVRVVPTNAVRASSPTIGMGGRSRTDVRIEGNDGSAASAADVLAQPTESATRDAQAEARSARRGGR